jgi:D-alanyl-D-alanine carboxypeptidase
VDGIKTGYTRASGFNLVTSVRRGGREFVAVVMGGPTAASRDQQMKGLIGSYLPGAMVARTGEAKLPARSRETQAEVSSRDANPSGPPKIRAASAFSP